MKNKLLYIFTTLSLSIILSLSSCSVFNKITKPSASFANVNYDTSTQTVTFDCTISDVTKCGSNFRIVLTDDSCTSEQNITVDSIDSTISESFTGLTNDSQYILKVICDYDSKTDEVIGSKYFNTNENQNTETDLATSLGITYQDSTIEYDASQHYLYASYGSQTITSSSYVTINSTKYYLEYDSSNRRAMNPGEYEYKFNIYTVTSSSYGFFSQESKELAETLSAKLSITKCSSIYTFNDVEIAYTGDSYEYPISVAGLTYETLDSNGNTVVAKNPGVYTINYNFEGNDYYDAINGSYTLTITKGTIVSYLTNQITELDSNGEAYITVDDSDFSVSGLKYSVKYFNSNGDELDKIVENGTYTYQVTVEGNDYYETLVTYGNLYVLGESNTPIFVSRVSSFSVETNGGKNKIVNYYNYVELYNQNINSIDLSNVKLSISGTNVNLTGTLSGNSTYTVLVYSYSKSITYNTAFSRYSINFTDYADQAVKNSSESKLAKVSITYNNITNNYSFETNYTDYFALLQYSDSDIDKGDYRYEYSTCSTIDEVVEELQNFNYTALSPSLTFTNSLSTISITRLNELYDVVANDYYNNSIDVDSSMVDTSEVIAENTNKEISVTYTIKDSYGNKTTRVRKLTLVDEEAPVIETVEGKSLTLDLNANVDLTSYFTITDAVDGNITLTSDMIETNLDTSIAGAYKVAIKVSDKAGNSQTLNLVIRVGITYTYLDTIATNTIKTKDTGEANAMPSSGNVKVLVVPISFNNASSSSINVLEACFNGNATTLSGESVSSYYNKSSYGKLNLSFDVYSSWIKMEKRYQYYDENISACISYALSVVDKTYDLSNYDSDSDGYIDSIWFIYDINYNSDTNYFWAWTSDFSGYSLSYDSKKVGKIAFASLEFADSSDSYYQSHTEYRSNKYTARTYIHETGHLLGLEDYYDYDYDYNTGVSHCMYGQSMMDENYGDLDAASKLLLGWVNPIVVSESDVVTIGSTALSSDNVILISKNIKSKKTIFNEYILLEFWTSDGLNAYDADKSFGSDAYGIRVLHLDATINYVNGKATQTSGNRPSYFKYNNTDDDSHNFLETLALNPSAIYNSTTRTYNVKNNVLFNDLDKVFGTDYYSTFTYNTGSAIDFTFNITSISQSSVTINITM